MDNLSNGLHHTYRRKGWLFTGFLGVFLFLLAVLQLLQKPQLPLVGLVIFLFSILLIYSAFSIRLTVSGEGIIYHQVGYSVFARWDQIVSLDECKAGRVRTDCLLLREYELRGAKWLANISGLRPKGKSIPVGLFDRNWREGNLGQDIEQHAPHVSLGGRQVN